MQQEFQKTFVETVSTTPGAEPEPSTSTNTEPSGSSPLGIKNAPAACHRLYKTDDGEWHWLDHGWGQGCSADHRGMLFYNIHRPPNPFLISYTSGFNTPLLLLWGLTKDLTSQLYQKHGGTTACQCHMTIGSSLLGISGQTNSLSAFYWSDTTNTIFPKSFSPSFPSIYYYPDGTSTPSVPVVGLTSSSSSSVPSIVKMTEIPSKWCCIVPTSLQTSESPPLPDNSPFPGPSVKPPHILQ